MLQPPAYFQAPSWYHKFYTLTFANFSSQFLVSNKTDKEMCSFQICFLLNYSLSRSYLGVMHVLNILLSEQDGPNYTLKFTLKI